MDEPVYQPLVILTRTGDLGSAYVLVARLQSEGVSALVRGEPMGPYPVTVGRMAVTEILVPDDEFESATALLEELTIEATSTEVELAGFGESPAIGTSFMWWLVAAVVPATMIWVRLSHYL